MVERMIRFSIGRVSRRQGGLWKRSARCWYEPVSDTGNNQTG
jgi:hypothetical protein